MMMMLLDKEKVVWISITQKIKIMKMKITKIIIMIKDNNNIDDIKKY